MNRSRPLVLLVDDEEDFLNVTELLLEMEGFVVKATSDSVDAVRHVQEQAVVPDIVMLDHRMPRLSGPEALRQMREAGLQAPALLVSAIQDIEAEAARHGFDACLPKPFSLEQLSSALRQLSRR